MQTADGRAQHTHMGCVRHMRGPPGGTAVTLLIVLVAAAHAAPMPCQHHQPCTTHWGEPVTAYMYTRDCGPPLLPFGPRTVPSPWSASVCAVP